MTFLQRRAKEFENFGIQAKLLKQILKVLVEHLLANIAFGTFAPVAGAVIVDVLLLLDFSDDGAATMAARHQS
ncbi:hypothetical protein [Sphingomonas melonis]|uniref:hypothetical protein n=1 Tax=Sphingomonas melonis TaxID=152682 RepID=UPI0004765146|nr:hypothetical protein [Sphingomonas melonis]